MNISKLKTLIDTSTLSKQTIAKRCGISRPTLDNVVNGADAKISTIESLASFFNIPVGDLFDGNDVNQSFNGNSNVVVGRDNNGHINMAECQDKLEDALLEIKHLKDVIDGKDKLLEEKERLINVLMNK